MAGACPPRSRPGARHGAQGSPGPPAHPSPETGFPFKLICRWTGLSIELRRTSGYLCRSPDLREPGRTQRSARDHWKSFFRRETTSSGPSASSSGRSSVRGSTRSSASAGSTRSPARRGRGSARRRSGASGAGSGETVGRGSDRPAPSCRSAGSLPPDAVPSSDPDRHRLLAAVVEEARSGLLPVAFHHD